jgi:hypothetical protein
MKLFYSLIILIILQNCSFDNKSGIWNNKNVISKKDDSLFKDFKKLSVDNKYFDKEILFNNQFTFNLEKPIANFDWQDVYFNQTNNSKNFKYNDTNNIVFKSKKLSKHKVNNLLLFENNNLIISDYKGNLITFSINQNKIISKFNFYKKKYKKKIKYLNLIIENNIIYVSDNIGYLYAFDYINNKILWAKNYKIPFRSNLKIFENKLIASNQNNNLYYFNKKNGNLLKLIPTEETTIKNQFINNLSLDGKTLFFLNTYGSLYAINNETMKINWFINLNQSIDLNPSNLFSGNNIVINNNKVFISSNKFTYIIDARNGSFINKQNYSSQLNPIVNSDYYFLLTKNNLIISSNINSGDIYYSYDINKKIAEFINTKKKEVKFKNFMILNNKIYIFLKNSYVLKLNINGSLEEIKKLPAKLNTNPIIIDGSLLYLNKQNKLVIIN